MWSSGGKGKAKKECLPHRLCWNCGEKGHYKDKCPNPKKSSDKKGNAKAKSSTANAAVVSDSEDEGAFFAEAEDDDNGWFSEVDEPEDDPSMLPLVVLSDSDNDEDRDCFSEVSQSKAMSNGITEELSRVNGSECGLFVDVDLDLVVAEAEDTAAHVAHSGDADRACVELYDSGCSKHITPYRVDIENFVEIPQKTFQAANKQSFKVVGKGELVIDILNGVDSSQLWLTEVLYSPEVGYTLVSVGRLDENGFSVTFGNGKCTI